MPGLGQTCQSQAAIWSVDALSHLVANSITEDRFGVVQKELPTILTSPSLDQKMLGPKEIVGAWWMRILN